MAGSPQRSSLPPLESPLPGPPPAQGPGNVPGGNPTVPPATIPNSPSAPPPQGGNLFPNWEGFKAGVASLADNTLGSLYRLATGQAGAALGDRAYRKALQRGIENPDAAVVVGLVGEDVIGAQAVEGISGYDLATSQPIPGQLLDGGERSQRLASGSAAFFGAAALGTGLVAKFTPVGPKMYPGPPSVAPNNEVPSVIYREGGTSPSNLTARPQDQGNLSVRDSLSNPIDPSLSGPLGGTRPILRPGEPYIAVDTSKLPPGSVRPDGVPGSLTTPPGHVSVFNVPPDVLKGAVIPKPATPPYGSGASGKLAK
jgi:hypothetical protein